MNEELEKIFHFNEKIIGLNTYKTFIDGQNQFVNSLGVNAKGEIQQFALNISKNIITKASTLAIIAENGDYNSATVIIRCIVDHMCVLKTIYANPNNIDKEYRHYLYMLDGYSSRLSSINKYDFSDTNEMNQLVYNEIKKLENNIKRYTDLADNHPYAKNHKNFHDKTVHESSGKAKYNWKYKLINNTPTQEFYSWKDLYNNLGLPKSAQNTVSQFSQNVHGLAMSNLFFTNLKEKLLILLQMTGLILYQFDENFPLCFSPQTE